MVAEVRPPAKHVAHPSHGRVLVVCDGSAHSNAYVDNCMSCAPRWGWREVRPGDVEPGAQAWRIEGGEWVPFVVLAAP